MPSGNSRGWAIVLVTISLTLAGITWSITRHHQRGASVSPLTLVTLRITDFRWERRIDVEAYETWNEGGWQVPHDGQLIGKEQRLTGHRQEVDHYETRTRQVEVQTGTKTETRYRTERERTGTRSE